MAHKLQDTPKPTKMGGAVAYPQEGINRSHLLNFIGYHNFIIFQSSCNPQQQGSKTP